MNTGYETCPPRTLHQLLIFVTLAAAACGSNKAAPSDVARPVADLGGVSKREGVVPPSRGMFLGVNEYTEGDLALFEQTLGRRAPLLWPRNLSAQSWGKEGVYDDGLNFNVAEAQRAWDQGYLVSFAFEPHPENGMRVDDLLRGKYDEHLSRVAGQIKAFGRPMFIQVAREPNGVLMEWMGGYGPAGDRSAAWAWENERATKEFDPSTFPRPELYRGLGDPNVDDGLERLAATQRYIHHYLVERQGIRFLSFDTMGWLVSEGDDGVATGQRFLDFHKMIAEHSDWISLNWYTFQGNESPDKALDRTLEMFDDYIQAIRAAKINKPIMITELGICGADSCKNTKAKRVFEALAQYPEVKAFVLWSVGDEDGDGNVDNSCLVDATVGLPGLKQAIDAQPDRFHSCLTDSTGRPLKSCDPRPSALSPLPD